MTKFRLSPEAFADALAWPTRVVRGVPPMPTLGGVLLDASQDEDGEGRLTLSTYDLTVSATSATTAQVITPGRALVSARLLSAIAKVLPDDDGDTEVEVTTDGSEAHLTVGSAEFTLPLIPVEHYPELPALPLPIGEVDSAVWTAAVQRVAPAADPKGMGFDAGILVRIEDGHLTLAATDRYTLTEAVAPWQPALPSSEAPRALLVPAATLVDASRAIAAKGGTVTLAADDEASGTFALFCGQQRMTTPVLDLKFPQYQHLVQFEPAYRAELPVEAMAAAVDRVGVTAAPDDTVTLRFEKDAVRLAAGLRDHDGVSRDVVPCQFTGAADQADPFTIHYSLARLRSALAAMHSEYAEFVFVSSTKQGVLRPLQGRQGDVTGDFLFMVAPINPRTVEVEDAA